MMNLFSSLGPLAVTLFISSEFQLTSANKTLPCYMFGCSGYNEICNPSSGKCLPCKCPPTEECFLDDVPCFKPPCQPVPSCRPKCFPGKCPDGKECKNGVCEDKCPCAKKTMCFKGGCFTEIPCDGYCKCGEKCYVGKEACHEPPCPIKVICLPDDKKCDVIRCAEGYRCVNGKCVQKV